jgi:hypothetical protein
MTLALALLLALFAAPADTTDGPAPPDLGRQVITRADIEAAGLYRLPDLFRLVDGARTATVDGFTWRASLLGGDPFGAEAWTLLVDGARVDIGLFGEQNLSLVPVAITHVDSVEVWTTPRVVAGTLASGVIHIHTSRAARGFAARVGTGVGNEVGDPGPYRYVPGRSSRNVDKFGSDYEGLVAGEGAAVRAQARFKWLRFYATDFAVIERNREALVGANPALRLFAPALRLEADALGGTHALQLLGGGSNDLWFFQPVGRELPVQRLYGQAALHGRVPLASHLGIEYRLSIAENRLDERGETALEFDPRWRARTVRGGLGARWQRGELTATLGGAVEDVTADGADPFTIGRLTGTLAHTAARHHYHFGLAFAQSDGTTATSVVAGARRVVQPRLTVGATAGVVQQLAEEAARFSFWRAQGYAAFEDLLSVEQPGVRDATGEAFLSANARARLGPILTLDASAAVRSFWGVLLETQPAAPFPDALRPQRTLVVEPEAEGEVVSGRVALRTARGRWRGRLFYDGQAAVGGDAAFERAWEAVPRHRAGLAAAFAPAPSFTVSGALTVRSAAHWPAYAALEGANDGLYDDDVPALWLLDAALEKWFWHRRFRTSLLFRNLLGQEERYHPVGAALDLRFYLRLELILG